MVVGQARGHYEGIALVRRAGADVVLLDVGLARRAETIAAIATTAPTARIVVLCVADAIGEVLPLAEAGIAGYVTREQSLTDLIDVVRSVVHNEMPCSPGVSGGLLRHVAALAASSSARNGDAVLTRREREIVELIRFGRSNREIAEDLVIELSTVKNHVHNILEKLQVKDRGQAVACLGRRPLEHAKA